MSDFANEREKNIKFQISLNSEQKVAKAVILDNSITYISGKAGSGKAQPLDSIIYTPKGPVRMGDIKVGDEILGLNKKTKVIGIFPQGVEDVYEITMSDGSKTKCSLGHLWQVQEKKQSTDYKWKILTTGELLENIKKEIYFRIPHQEIINFDYKEVKINPYLLGILIAEGHLRENNISFSTSDSFILNKIQNIVEKTDGIVKHKINYDYSITKKKLNRKKSEISNYLNEVGLLSKLSYDKFIPDDYKYNSVEVRKELLQGLIDGDGYVSKKGEIEYNTSSYQLAEDVAEVVRSLGGRVFIRKKFPSYTYKGEKLISNKLNYTLSIVIDKSEEIISLPRKLERVVNFRKKVKYYNRYIKSIEKVGEGETQCIKVDAKDELYITDNFIVTHNTLLCCQVALDLFFKKQVKHIIITRPAVEAGEKLGFLPGGLEEKLDPYVQAIYQNFYALYKKEKVDKMIQDGIIQIRPFAYMRGSTFCDAVIIVDEVQNTTESQVKMVMERLGKGSKMMLCGDVNQIDLARNVTSGIKFLDYLKENGLNKFEKVALLTNHRDPIVEDILNLYESFKNK
jgi:phosphate starvation-inducible protein PhoH